jgi:acyl dehydratase
MAGMPTPFVFTGPCALLGAAGKTFGPTEWRVIDQATVDAFAAVTGDTNWLHVDPSRAATTPFGGTIAHGMLTLAMAPVLAGQLYRVRGAARTVSYGLDRVRFPAPVRVGTRIRVTVTIMAVEDRGTHVRLSTRLTVDAFGSDRPVCVADKTTCYYLTR